MVVRYLRPTHMLPPVVLDCMYLQSHLEFHSINHSVEAPNSSLPCTPSGQLNASFSAGGACSLRSFTLGGSCCRDHLVGARSNAPRCVLACDQPQKSVRKSCSGRSRRLLFCDQGVFLPPTRVVCLKLSLAGLDYIWIFVMYVLP